MVECKKFREMRNGCLVGYADVFIPKFGLEINGLKLFEKDARRWIAMPDREYVNKDGEKKYAPIVCFKDKKHFEVFSEQVKEAIATWTRENGIYEQAGDSAQVEFAMSREEETDLPF